MYQMTDTGNCSSAGFVYAGGVFNAVRHRQGSRDVDVIKQ